MAKELEALGYGVDDWKLCAFVGSDDASLYSAGAAPLIIGFEPAGANDANTPFPGFSSLGCADIQANVLPSPIGSDSSGPTLANESIGPAAGTSLPNIAPAPSIAPLADADVVNDGVTGIITGQVAAGGSNNEVIGAPNRIISNPGNFNGFDKPAPSGDPAFAPSSAAPAVLVLTDDTSEPSGSSLNGPQTTPFQPTTGVNSPSSASASISTLDPIAGNTGSNAPSGGSSVTFDVSVAGSGLVFDNTITSGFTSAFEADIIDTEDILAEHWTNSITLNLDFSAANKGANGGLASNSWPSFVAVSYATLKSALAAHDQGSVYAEDAVAALPTSDPNPAGGNDWNLPEAYARMLGLSASTPSVDDTITLNTYYLSDSSVGQDVIDTMTHEISEGGMGRVGGLGDQNGVWSAMDLFRYNSSGVPDYSDGRDGAAAYFSYNGGQTLSLAAGLSFNNEYNSQDVKVNGGDTADFTQLDVFGVGEVGETFGLSQTDIEVLDVLGWNPMPPTPTPPSTPSPSTPPPSTPSGATCDMVMQDTNGGNFELYDLGGNSVLAAYPMGNVGLNWLVLGFGDFAGNPSEADMLMRDSNTGNLEYYDIRASQIVSAGSMGNIGLAWQLLGFGDFSGNPNETDMIWRNGSTGALEYYDIQNNQVVGAGPIGNVGLNWQMLGVGDFSGNPNESDLLIRDTNNGNLQYLDIRDNQVVGAGPIGNIGLNWQMLGVGDFSSNPNESDLLMRDTNNGNLEYFDIQNNQIVGAAPMGNIGVNWQVAGFADISGNPNESDMIMRDNNTGNFDYFDIQHNEMVKAGPLGNVGLDWQTLGVAGPIMLGSQLL